MCLWYLLCFAVFASYVAGLIFLVGGIYDSMPKNIFIGVVILLVTLLITVITLIRLFKDVAREQKIRDLARNNLSFKDNVLTLRKRAPENRSLLRCSEILRSYLKHHSAQITYTGVSSGGISTGGFDVTPEHYTLEGGSKSGKYRLEYTDAEYGVIHKIVLETDNLVDDATYDPAISSRLEWDSRKCESYIRIEHSLSSDFLAANRDVINRARASGNQSMVHTAAQEQMIAAALTYQECQDIISWICGE